MPSVRVVVTGIGIISPLGLDAETTWRRILAGHSGIDHITFFDTAGYATTIGGELKGFAPEEYLGPKEAKRTDRFAQLAVAAAKQAVDDAGLKLTAKVRENMGVIIGNGIGGLSTLYQQTIVLHEKGPNRLSPFAVPMMIADMASGWVSIALGLKGPNFCTTSACASGSDAIGIAGELIRSGYCPLMLAGGSEAAINPLGIASFSALKALSGRNDPPPEASCPFDAKHDGFVMSEGASVLVLEDMEHARRRGAKIIAELIGYGATADAFHITQPLPNGDGAARAIRQALARAKLKPADIDYVNAHGTSTPLNDRTETRALKAALGPHAYKVPISSTKSMTGHLIGAAGAIEAAFCALTIRDGLIPPTINLHHPDPECDLDYVPGKARRKQVKVALSNSFGFGGHNSVLILHQVEEDTC
ncbi:MAG: beta-ketoacyl-ACP synthase II [Dehalococcoidia bacterium]|nr:beta-ketoacyl-ACP synthase II [Dehalococcoidia bacterium]